MWRVNDLYKTRICQFIVWRVTLASAGERFPLILLYGRLLRSPTMSQAPQQAAPSAPDSPALVVTSNVQKYAIKKKKVLSAEDAELFELTQAAGITVDQEVFK